MTTKTNSIHLIVGCGYLGERVAAAWHAEARTICVLTRSPEHVRRFESRGWQPILGDVTAPESLRALPAVDTLLYAVGFDRSSGQTQREVYVDGLRNLLDSFTTLPRRLVYVSSTSVYGQNAGEWVDEESSANPTSDNGQVCREAEKLLLAKSPAATIVRSAGIYGPGRLIARIESLRQGRPLSGNPQAWLNLIHVDDLTTAVLEVADRGQAGQIYLASDDRPIQRSEYYSLLAELVAAPKPTYQPLSADSPERHQLNKRCRNRKLREELGWRPSFPTIGEGLRAGLAALDDSL